MSYSLIILPNKKKFTDEQIDSIDNILKKNYDVKGQKGYWICEKVDSPIEIYANIEKDDLEEIRDELTCHLKKHPDEVLFLYTPLKKYYFFVINCCLLIIKKLDLYAYFCDDFDNLLPFTERIQGKIFNINTNLNSCILDSEYLNNWFSIYPKNGNAIQNNLI